MGAGHGRAGQRRRGHRGGGGRRARPRPGAEPIARRYLVLLLLAVFPANIQMAVAPDTIRGAKGVPPALLWARLPLQALPIWWVLRTLKDD